jgi:quercetin dioxygenase-like cupin family protein
MYPRLLLSDETPDHCSLTSQVEHNLTLFEHNKKGRTTMTTYESSVKGLHAGEGETVAIGQELYTMKAASADTGGALGVFLVITEPQAGPPPHIHHREDEAWYILEGNYAFTIGDQVQSLVQGRSSLAPGTFLTHSKTWGRVLAGC